MTPKPPSVDRESAKPRVDRDDPCRWEQRLDSALRDGWKRYRDVFKRARRQLSPKAVHQLRIETRRILSFLNLVEPLVGRRAVAPARRQFRKTLKSFARLRDTQVQLLALNGEHRQHPHAKALTRVLERREEKLTHHAERRFHTAALGALKEVFVPVKKAAQAQLRRGAGETRTLAAIVGAVDKAFAVALERRRAIDPSDPATLHRLRVAFKKFRYMIEDLREILPGPIEDHRRAMRVFQTRLGEIQDARLLLEDLDGLSAKARLKVGAVGELRKELTRSQRRLIDEFLRMKDPLRNFWPPRGGIAKLLSTDNASIRA